MIYLDTYHKSIQVVCTIPGIDWTSSWVEGTKNCQGGGSSLEIFKEDQGVTIFGTVEVVSAPTKNDNTKTYVKKIEYLSCYNSTTSSGVVTFQIDNNGTPRILCQFVLDPGSNATYNEDSGWKVLNKYGVTPTPIIGDMIYIIANGTDTYTASSGSIVAYMEGTTSFACKFVNANTGPATLNINGLGAIPLKNFGNAALAANDIKAGQILDITYDGTNFQIKSVTDNIVNAI